MTKITADMLVGDVLDAHPELAKFFLEIGMHCLGCPMSRGESIKDNSGYEGNPLCLRFDGDVRSLPDVLAQCGAGHHWIGLSGDWVEELRLFARMTGLKYTFVEPKAK